MSFATSPSGLKNIDVSATLDEAPVAMLRLLVPALQALHSALKSQRELALENLALRHQLGVLHRSVKRPRLRKRDRIFWVWLSQLWANWQSCLVIVKPETVICWHRHGFRLYWRWKSRRGGRPKKDAERRALNLDRARKTVARVHGMGRASRSKPSVMREWVMAV